MCAVYIYHWAYDNKDSFPSYGTAEWEQWWSMYLRAFTVSSIGVI